MMNVWAQVLLLSTIWGGYAMRVWPQQAGDMSMYTSIYIIIYIYIDIEREGEIERERDR